VWLSCPHPPAASSLPSRPDQGPHGPALTRQWRVRPRERSPAGHPCAARACARSSP
jgi:hypothetical protein